MTNQIPSPSPNHEHHDEAIAAIIALLTLGTVFFVAVARNGGVSTQSPTNVPNLTAIQLEADPLLADTDESPASARGLRLPFPGLGVAETDRALETSDEDTVKETGEEEGDRSAIATLFPLDSTTAADNPDGNETVLFNAALGEEDTPEVATEVSPEQVEEPGANPDDEDQSVEPLEPSEPSTALDTPDLAESALDVAGEVPDLAEEVPAEAFADVAPQYWATPFIEGLRQQGIATGFVGGGFEPDTVISRAQFASQLDRAFSNNERSPQPNYSDVPEDHPQYDAIVRMTQSGFVQGYDVGTFLPDKQVSRMEVLLALVAGLELTPSAEPDATLKATFQDSDTIPLWAVDAIATATELELVVSPDNPATFDPSKPATRAEAAAMLYQALAYMGEVSPVESEYIVRPQ